LKITRFEWDDGNTEHISRHSVTPYEAEEVFADDAAIFLRSRSGRYVALGQTEAGRYLTVVYERKSGGVIRVVTAFDMDEKNRRRYRHERRS
jgi:hypothetical protein